MDSLLAYAELLEVDESFWVLTAETGIPAYDFRFDAVLPCRRLRQTPDEVRAVARVGPIARYGAVHEGLKADGIVLVNDPEEYRRASDLTGWYPLLSDMTPKSLVFTHRPDPALIDAELGWPIFIKGVHQTSGHRAAFSIIAGPEALERALAMYAADPILRWQGIACRELVRLRLVAPAQGGRLPAAFEFRTFWWRGELVGWGRYWWDGPPYQPTEREAAEMLAMAGEAARRLRVPFLVVDVAQREDGRWLVVECNDGQESGYAGASPLALWQRVMQLERGISLA